MYTDSQSTTNPDGSIRIKDYFKMPLSNWPNARIDKLVITDTQGEHEMSINSMLQEEGAIINTDGNIILGTAGKDNLGKLAPKFAELNDDVLFGEVWSREDKLSLRDRSMITISALMAQGLYPQVKAHLILGKEHGLTKEEVVEIVTQLAFYTGWPKAWSVFPLIEEVYND